MVAGLCKKREQHRTVKKKKIAVVRPIVPKGLTSKMNISQSAFVPENLASRDGFGSPVSRQPVHPHTQAGSGAYLRDFSRVPRRRPLIYFKPPYIRHRVSPKFIRPCNCVPMAFTAESPPAQGP